MTRNRSVAWRAFPPEADAVARELAGRARHALGEAPVAEAPRTSWDPVDWSTVGVGPIDPPRYLLRADGFPLLYPGKTHSLFGASECGKSWIAQHAAAQVLADPDGGDVLYVDFEDSAQAVRSRFLALGSDLETIAARLVYVVPDASTKGEAERASFERLTSRRFALAVLDGYTNGMTRFDLDGRAEADVAAFDREVTRPLAERTGAAVVSIDHVTQAGANSTRNAVGSQHKTNVISGVGIFVRRLAPFSKGSPGSSELWVTKDRPGSVRSGGTRLDGNGSTLIGVFGLTPLDGGERVSVLIEAPDSTRLARSSGLARQPGLMQKVSAFIEAAGEPLSIKRIETAISGAKKHVSDALEALVEGGYVERLDGPRNAKLHQSIRVYLAESDPVVSDLPDLPATSPSPPRGEVGSEETRPPRPPRSL